MNTRIFPESICIEENPFLIGEMGSAPFDDEGVKVRPRLVVENGVIKATFYRVTAQSVEYAYYWQCRWLHNLRMFDNNSQAENNLNKMFKLMGTDFLLQS